MDVKAAVRFLRAHAQEFYIDAQREACGEHLQAVTQLYCLP